MAFKFSNLFSIANAKSRILIIVSVVIAVVMVIFFGSRFIFSEEPTVASRVANAPAGLQSVPGGEVTSEYYQALEQRNVQAAQQAQMTGESAVPTMIRGAGSVQSTGDQCTILCPGDENANVEDDINNLVKLGKLTQEEANQLIDLANKNVSVEEYAAALDRLVKEGKLTPDQARQLLAKYKKQHENALLNESAKTMDALIQSGQLSLDDANKLLALQKQGASVDDYAAMLDRMVREGKISPATAQQLLAQYRQQKAKEATQASIFGLQQLAKSGAITPEVAAQLADLQNKDVSVDQYAAELQKLVAAGKLTPETAAKLLEQYRRKKDAESGLSAINQAVAQQEAAAAAEVTDLLNSGKISKDVAAALLDMQKRNVSPEEYQNYLNRLVQEGKISPEDAQRLMNSYRKLHGMRAEAQRLQAQARLAAAPVTGPAAPGGEDFAQLQQQIQAQAAAAGATSETVTTTTQTEQVNPAEAQAAALEAQQARLQRIQAIQAAMSAQAQSLVAAWQPSKMVHVGGSAADKSAAGLVGPGGEKVVATQTTTTTEGKTGRPLIKLGTIYYGVLDTAVDSDYPDTPVMATIVQGPFKGAKLLGRLTLVQGKDRVSLQFNQMDKDEWPKGKTINAFAIDPDTARTVMASSVDHHYLMRYGSIMATSFLTGYANAIQQAGTSQTSIFGTTSTTKDALSPGNKIAVGLGQIGTTLGGIVQGYVNTPNTVKVDAGVGIGILFMGDVT